MTTKVCLLIRVSTEKQDTDRQLNELTEYCLSRNFEITKTISTTVSGSKTGNDRPDLIDLFEAAKRREFSKVLVTEISRLGRKAKDIRRTIDTLHELKISIIFKNFGGMESLDESDGETFVTNIIISIYAELAQEERRLLIERTKSGLVTARLKGKVLGRPMGKEDNEAFLRRYPKLTNDLKDGLSLNQCMKLHDLSKNTVIKMKRMMN